MGVISNAVENADDAPTDDGDSRPLSADPFLNEYATAEWQLDEKTVDRGLSVAVALSHLIA